MFFLPQAREHLFPAGACLWKAISLWLVEKTRHPSFERPGICSTHSIPVYVLIQLCSVLGQALTSNFSDAGMRGVYWLWRRLSILAQEESFLLWVGASKPAPRERAGRGRSWQGLKICSYKREEAGVLARRWPSTHPSWGTPAPTRIGCLALGHWAVASTAEWLQGSMEAASPLPSGSKRPLRSGPLGAGTPSSATLRTKFITYTLSNILPSWRGINCIDWGLGHDRGVSQT